MAYKNIIVFVDDGKANAERTEAAFYLAKTHEAELTAVALGSMKPIYAPKINKDASARMAKRLAINLLREFLDTAKEKDIKAEPLILYGDIVKCAERMSQFSHNHDLVMLAQPNPSRDNFHLLKSFAEDTLLLSGRPVLFMPYIGMRKTAINKEMKKVMIAWDGTPSATRALHDSIPLLKRADEVTILVVKSYKQKAFKTDVLVTGLNKHLCNHGINSSNILVDPGRQSIASVILNQITDKGIDLLVMGGYGTPKIRQKIFGGVSATILSSMTIPVLMSH